MLAQVISQVERVWTTALVLLPSSSIHRVHAIELRQRWRSWLEKNAHLSVEFKSLLDVAVSFEIEHLIQASIWTTELRAKSAIQYATPQISREAYSVLLDTLPLSDEHEFLYANMGGHERRVTNKQLMNGTARQLIYDYDYDLSGPPVQSRRLRKKHIGSALQN